MSIHIMEDCKHGQDVKHKILLVYLRYYADLRDIMRHQGHYD